MQRGLRLLYQRCGSDWACCSYGGNTVYGNANCYGVQPKSENSEETIRSEYEEFDLAWCFYGLTANPTKPIAGRPFEFSVWLMVPDVVERPGKAFLVINGEVVEHCDIFFDADCTELLKMEHTFTKPGSYEVRIDAAVGKNAAYQPGSHEQIMHIKVIE